MSTKAEDEKARVQQENGAKKAKLSKRAAAKPAKKASAKHQTKHAARATFAREESESTPSRKSTRKSANGVKADNNLRRRAMRKVRSPESRASRAAAREA